MTHSLGRPVSEASSVARSRTSPTLARARRSRGSASLINDWRADYNTYRPHQSLGYLTPVDFARRWRKEQEVRVSQQVDR